MTPLARHRCHAEGCRVIVPAAKFMCLADWRMVPKALKDAIWLTYVPGQETRKDPTPEYLEAARVAIAAVKAKKLAKAARDA